MNHRFTIYAIWALLQCCLLGGLAPPASAQQDEFQPNPRDQPRDGGSLSQRAVGKTKDAISRVQDLRSNCENLTLVMQGDDFVRDKTWRKVTIAFIHYARTNGGPGALQDGNLVSDVNNILHDLKVQTHRMVIQRNPSADQVTWEELPDRVYNHYSRITDDVCFKIPAQQLRLFRAVQRALLVVDPDLANGTFSQIDRYLAVREK